MIGSPSKRHAVRESGANPGRSRRCKGSCSSPTSHWPERAGKAARGEPRVRRPTACRQPEPLAEGGFVFRRLMILAVLAALFAVLAEAALGVNVKVRVEGRTQTIYGSAEPTLSMTGTNALDALDTASARGEFYYHVTQFSFGPFVDQIGRFASEGSNGWSYKVNGKVPRRRRQRCRAEGRRRRALVLEHLRPDRRLTDARPSPPAEAQLLLGPGAERHGHLDGSGGCRSRRRRPSPRDPQRPGVHRQAPRAGAGGTGGSRPIQRAALAGLCAVLVLAGCGSEPAGTGTASLWITRDRGREVVLVKTVPAGLTAMQALDREADIETRYGGRFVQSIEGLEGDIGARVRTGSISSTASRATGALPTTSCGTATWNGGISAAGGRRCASPSSSVPSRSRSCTGSAVRRGRSRFAMSRVRGAARLRSAASSEQARWRRRWFRPRPMPICSS